MDIHRKKSLSGKGQTFFWNFFWQNPKSSKAECKIPIRQRQGGLGTEPFAAILFKE